MRANAARRRRTTAAASPSSTSGDARRGPRWAWNKFHEVLPEDARAPSSLLPHGLIVDPVGAALRFRNPVRFPDPRPALLHLLLRDLAGSRWCMILGAGSSAGAVPFSQRELTERAIRFAKEPKSFTPQSLNEAYSRTPALKYVDKLLQDVPLGAVDRWVLNLTSHAAASFWIQETFTRPAEVPSELVEIFDVLGDGGSIVTYNYDRIAELQKRFPAHAVHGQVAEWMLDPDFRADAREFAYGVGWAPRLDVVLPGPESEDVRQRKEFQEARACWEEARSLVLVGYDFGGGDDHISWHEFTRSVRQSAPVHIVNPNASRVVERISDGLRRFNVNGHPFGWSGWAKAVLAFLRSNRHGHVAFAIGHEREIVQLYDRAAR